MRFNNQSLTTDKDETVLELLLRNNIDISYSCESGLCQSCILECHSGEIDELAQKDLKSTAIAQGHFLACQQKAFTIHGANFVDERKLFNSAQLIEKHFYTSDIVRLRLMPSDSFFYHAGQFINLKNKHGVIRSYSLASHPSLDPFLEIHVRRKDQGKMSNWLIDELHVNDFIQFQGPIGNSFFDSKNKSSTLMLLGTGTGAAPLIGIAKDALHSQYTGDIYFYHGVREKNSLYLETELRAMQSDYENFFYRPCVSGLSESKDLNIRYGRCNDIALNELTDKTSLLYLCGNAKMVSSTKKSAFLSGLSLKNIYSDPFEHQDLRLIPR